MGVDIPQPFRSRIEGAVGPVTVDGIPDHFDIAVTQLPKIQLGVDPITLNPVTATMELKPLDLNVSLKELPERRTHLPANFSVGLSVLGVDLMSVRLCGEAQMVSENYRPNPCERCGPAPARDAAGGGG